MAEQLRIVLVLLACMDEGVIGTLMVALERKAYSLKI